MLTLYVIACSCTPQVMLRPRSLLLYQGGAYALRHGIRDAATDRVSELCANVDGLLQGGAGAYVKVGDAVERGEKRQSVVFVRKGLNHDHGGTG
jgi:hypothetical protein